MMVREKEEGEYPLLPLPATLESKSENPLRGRGGGVVYKPVATTLGPIFTSDETDWGSIVGRSQHKASQGSRGARGCK